MIRKDKYPEEIAFISKALDMDYQLSDDAKSLLFENIKREERKKGDFLFQTKEEIQRVYVFVKGAFKDFTINEEGDEVLLTIGFEGDMCMKFSSYMPEYPIEEHFLLYEDAVLYSIEIEFLRSLYATNLEWANWGRCLAENLALEWSYFADRLRYLKAKERYLHLLRETPSIANRIPLQDIASYLGITPVSLSRIRKEISNL
ncbi:Crp/Fnr family transcriptional regulator [Flammeovirga aprica]|uniref:Crp/Fnr family transcriptional regulator n=1 Tax=Flammeovirga aprica JL-4 TaxID=694437 RepID=A0A7X9RUV4_9BACT|nr:Crp/Fnr family transcriptional regulator [Flammeovirga aprica]NME69154.1 Crp/Fnr family transcriptional regulator [Flammeovirga aprica JL-4]